MAHPLLALMRRESRGARGRLVFMTACLALGVTAVTGVSALVGAVSSAIERDARTLLAADLVIEARRPLGEDVREALRLLGLERSTDVVELSAMVRAREARQGTQPGTFRTTVLTELKAAGELYPLYGAVLTEPAGVSPGALADDECIAAPELLVQLGVEVGGALEMGGQPFTVVASLVDEPDRVDFAMTLGPRLFVGMGGLERTGLVRFGSRVKYKKLVALEPQATGPEARGRAVALKALMKGSDFIQIKTFDRPSPGVSRALKNIGSYLGLVALLSLLLGGIGVAQVVRAWLSSRTVAIATLRTLGFRPREVVAAYLGHVLVLALIGSLIGALVGLAVPHAVHTFAPDLLSSGAGPIRWRAAARGIVLGLGTATIFAIPPLTAVWRVSPARALRVEAAPLAAPRVIMIAAGVLLVGGVLLFAQIQVRNWLSAAAFTGGLIALVALLTGAATLVSRLAARVPRLALGPTLRHGVAALARPGAGVVGASVALGLGTLVVVALGLVGARFEQELVNGAPPDAPSVFLVDVQPDQWDGVRAILRDEGAQNIDSTPVVMARLARIAGVSVKDAIAAGDGRQRWRLTREQRLTWATALPDGNELVEGELWSDPKVDEISLEVEFARTLGVGVGDTLTFDVQGAPMTFTVTSLREVDWGSFRINFFMLVEPGPMVGAPGWRLAAATLPREREAALQARVVDAYPNVSVLRIRPLMERVAATLGRIATAVRLLGGFTVLTGIAILAGAIAASSMRRGAEAALLKTLGVTRRGVALLFAIEFGLLGLVAGLLGGVGALVLAWGFLTFALHMNGLPSLASIPLAAIGTALLATIAGLSASAHALRVRPIESLRG